MQKPLVIFKTKLPKLNINEKQVLKFLVEAAKLIVPVYELQENRKNPGANFYPKNVTKEEIEQASKVNPEILSPYTIVEKKDGQLIVTPYHIKYAKLLKPVVKKLQQAAKITENSEFAKRLEKQAQALLDGSYEEANIYWMSMKPYKFNIVIGPIERYDDRLFFIKTAYQAWIGVLDSEYTGVFNRYKPIILASRRKIIMPSEKVDYYDKVQTRVDNAVIYAGRIARTLPVGINLPNDPLLMEKYGSEITVFRQLNQERVKIEILPAFNKFFSPAFKKEFSPRELEDGCLYGVILHELAHTYLRYRNSERNLKDLFPVIDELSASVMGMKVCGPLILKDIMTTKQLESIILAYLARNFYLVTEGKNNLARAHYISGAAIFINYLLESGAIRSEGGISWPNFMKIFVSVEELASVLERMLYQGTREDAESFINRYSNIEGLQRFRK